MMNIPEHNLIPHLYFREDFKNELSVLGNNFSIIGSPSIDNGINDFSSSNYLTRDIHLSNNFSLVISLDLIDDATLSYRVLNRTSDSAIRILWNSSTDVITLVILIGGVTRYLTTANLSGLHNKKISLGITCEYDGTNSTLKAYVNGVQSGSTVGPYAGHVDKSYSNYTLGTGSGVSYPGKIYDFSQFNYTLTEQDLSKIHGDSYSLQNNTFEENFVDSDSVEENGFTIVGSPTINNGISGFVDTSDYLIAPDIFKYKSVSFSVKVFLPSTLSGYNAILGWGADWRVHFYAGNNVVYFRYMASSTPRIVGVDATSLLDSTVTISCTLREEGANTVSAIYVNNLSSGRSDAGTIDDPSGDFLIGDSLGLGAWGSTIYGFKYFDHVITQEDHEDVIWEDDFVSGLSFHEKFEDKSGVERNGITVVGSPTINHGISNLSTSDYCLFNYTFSSSFSVFVRLIVADNGVTWERIFESQNIYFRLAWDPTNNRYYARTKIGTSYISTHLNLDMTSYIGREVSIGFTYVYDGANTTCHAYLNGVLKNSSGANPGTVETTDNPIWFGVSSGASSSAFRDEIKELRFYNIVLTENDFYMLHNDPSLFAELQPEKNLFLVKGNSSYNDGANQVTDCLGSVIDKATMGDGSTPSTYPALDNKNYSFSGNDYINGNDNDDFSISLNNPITIGGFFTIDDFLSTQGLLGKLTSTLTGEWGLYIRSTSRFRWVVVDNANGGHIYVRTLAVPHYQGRHFFLAATYDGSGTFNVNTTKIYIDGISQGSLSGTTVGTFISIQNTNTDVVVGSFSDIAAELQGKCSVPFATKKELSPLQIEILYNDFQRYLNQ